MEPKQSMQLLHSDKEPGDSGKWTAADQALSVEIALRQRTEQALEASEERFSLLVSGLKEIGFFMVNCDGVVISWNLGAEQMFGYRAEEIVGKSFGCLFTPEDQQQGVPEEELKTAMSKGVAEDDRWHMRKDGSRFWVNGVVTLVKNRRVQAFAKIVRNLTHYKEAEEAIRKSEARHRQVAEQLAEAHQRKDEFLAMLAHELRNPMAAVRNGLHILRLASADPVTAERAREIVEAQVQHLTRLVDDLLDVSRITSGRIQLRKEKVELKYAVKHAVESSRPLIESRKQKLTVDLPLEPVHLEADPTRLEQILSNLLNNAGKYTKEGGQIHFGAERDGGDIVVRVRDTGIGIPADLLPKIFDLFVQGNQTPNHPQGGLGIGLTLVKKLVELHGGSVSVHSEGADKGSEFIVRLPAFVPGPGDAVVESTARGASGGARLRVLVVEDTAVVAESFRMMLELWGHEVRVAFDGHAALLSYRTFQPDVVLLDIGLPGMSGLAVARQIRQEPTMKKPLLVALSGYCQEEDKRRALVAGFDFHITKPVDPTELEQLLATASRESPAAEWQTATTTHGSSR